MKKSLVIKIVVGVAILALVAGAWAAVKKDDKSVAGKELNVAVVSRGNVESVVTAQGKLEPKEYVDVGAQVSGQIKVLHVDFGDNVKKDQLIAEIDPDVYESQVKSDLARLKALEAQMDEQEAGVKQAQQKLERNRKLYQTKAVSQEVYQDAQTALDIAEAQLMSLDAQMEETQSILEGDQANLGYTKIYSPMDGTVVSLSIKEGQTINANQTAPVIGQVANLDVMTVRAQVAEADITRLKDDMNVYFTTLGSQERKWQGRIRQILPSPETVNDVVLYNVLVDVDNKDRQLMTGMTTQLFFVLGKADNALVIPASALVKRAAKDDTADGKAYTIEVMKGRKSQPRTVLIGLSDRTSAQVIAGLNEGDKIVLPTPVTPQGQAPSQAGGMRRMPRL